MYSADSVLRILSHFNWQGCSVLLSLTRQKSTLSCQNPFSSHNRHRFGIAGVTGYIGRTMGSFISRGRKYSPKQIDSVKNPDTFVEHARFACDDASARNNSFIEGIVCREDELEENQMKVFNVGDDDTKILVVKQKGVISALGSKCTHYGAPLINGYLGNGRIRCQWHGACFNIRTGDIEDFPGLDSLPCYEVKVVNGNVLVRAKREILHANKRVKPFACRDKCDNRTFVIVGGGPAGANCAETLRQQGFSGRLVLICGENYLPYDRIKLSKALDVEVSKILLRSDNFYQERSIEIKTSTEAVCLNPNSKLIVLSNGEELKYDKIFLATGATPRQLTLEGSDSANVFVLRTADDANKIKSQLSENSNVIILGTSFIGMEAAAYCVGKAKSVTVIGRDAVPFRRVFGDVIGRRLLELFQEKGVQFRLGCNIASFEVENGNVTKTVLDDSSTLDTDICLIAIGVIPNTGFLSGVNVKLDKGGAIEVDEYLQTSLPDVYAGGDVASAPVFEVKANIGHWGLANYHGHIAAFNMLGMNKCLNAVPFFWTVLFGKSVRYAGFTQNFDDVVIDGDVEELKFAAFYCSGDTVAAISTLNRDPLAAKFAEMLHEGKKLSKSKISSWLI